MTMNRRGVLMGSLVAPLAASTLAAETAASQAMAATPSATPKDKTVPLWPGRPSGGEKVIAQEKTTDTREKPDQPNRSIEGVRIPDIIVRHPAKPNGAAMLILPGGGFRNLAYDKEGTEIADWLLTLGFVTAVLKYRLPSDGWTAGIDVAVADAQRAMRLLRQEMAKETQSKDARVGAIGFSAGGYLTAALGTRFSETLDGNVDAADAQSARPDFVALIYPGFGAPTGPIPPLADKVTTQTPPAFIVHANDDPKAPAIGSTLAAVQLLKFKVPVELHMFETGGHGFALRRPPSESWPDLFDRWVRPHLKPA